jgi:hypothetical protein
MFALRSGLVVLLERIMAEGKIELTVSESESPVAYVSLPDHPRDGTAGCVAKTLRLRDLCGAYVGPDVYLDFNRENCLIGLEILT